MPLFWKTIGINSATLYLQNCIFLLYLTKQLSVMSCVSRYIRACRSDSLQYFLWKDKQKQMQVLYMLKHIIISFHLFYFTSSHMHTVKTTEINTSAELCAESLFMDHMKMKDLHWEVGQVSALITDWSACSPLYILKSFFFSLMFFTFSALGVRI